MKSAGQNQTKLEVLNQLYWAHRHQLAYQPSQEQLEAIWPCSRGGVDAASMLQDIEYFAAQITA